jgi:hypothetical protein
MTEVIDEASQFITQSKSTIRIIEAVRLNQ